MPFRYLCPKQTHIFPFFFPHRSEKIYYYPEACKSVQIYYPVLIKFICWFIHFTSLKKPELKALQKLCGDGVTILFLSLWAISQPCLMPAAKASHSRLTHFVCRSKNGHRLIHLLSSTTFFGLWGRWRCSCSTLAPTPQSVPALGKEAAEPSSRAHTRGVNWQGVITAVPFLPSLLPCPLQGLRTSCKSNRSLMERAWIRPQGHCLQELFMANRCDFKEVPWLPN